MAIWYAFVCCCLSNVPHIRSLDLLFDSTHYFQELWRQRVDNYWHLLGAKIQANSLRNLMDMNACLGSFADALKDEPVWVMNVVPEDGLNTLKIIYDRGLISAMHDW